MKFVHLLSDPKALSLIVLTLQNTCLVLTMRISRTREDGPMYLASVAVMTDELMKICVCMVMLVLAYRTAAKGYMPIDGGESVEGGVKGFWDFFRSEVFKSTFDFFKMSIPAFLYAIQKNMLYVAISNLDAAVFQVAYQGKILTTAVFSVIVLGKKLSGRQIIALLVLLAGVAMVQLSAMDGAAKAAPSSSGRTDNVVLGCIAVLVACMTSGFAAIYFEWILKKSTPVSQQAPHALWVRNFQLAVFAGIGAAIGVLSKDGAAVMEHGLYQGFSPLVWVVVSLEAFGGIVVALVIKYADNILKNFATAVSIVTSVVVSALFLGFSIKPSFVFGGLCVMAAVVLYTSNQNAPLFSRAHDKADGTPVRDPESSGVEMARDKAEI